MVQKGAMRCECLLRHYMVYDMPQWMDGNAIMDAARVDCTTVLSLVWQQAMLFVCLLPHQGTEPWQESTEPCVKATLEDCLQRLHVLTISVGSSA